MKELKGIFDSSNFSAGIMWNPVKELKVNHELAFQQQISEWNPVKELKVAKPAFDLPRKIVWNPVKELKDLRIDTDLLKAIDVESGEGIESSVTPPKTFAIDTISGIR